MIKFDNVSILSLTYKLLDHMQNETMVMKANFSTLLNSSSTIFENTTSEPLTFEVKTQPEAYIGFTMDYDLGKCVQICGDGMVVILECDDNNTIDFDGCSSTCKIEPFFNCTGQPSVCSFASNVNLSIVNQTMEPLICNTITFEVQLEPSSATFAQSYVKWENFITTQNATKLELN